MFADPTWSRAWMVVGCTMVHFIWVGALIGLVAWCCRAAMRQWPLDNLGCNLHYGCAFGLLLTLAAAPPGIPVWLLVVRDRLQEITEPPTSVVASIALDGLSAISGLDHQHSPTVENAGVPHSAVSRIQASAKSARRSFSDLAARLANVPWYLPWIWLVGAPPDICLAWRRHHWC